MLADRLHLLRSARYIHLNPCRAGLAKDPLEWEWSTHRDLVGAVANPWLDLARLRELWRNPAQDFARSFHEYVSSDPSVKVAGTPLPELKGEPKLAATLERVGEAVLQVLRAPNGALRKKGAPARVLAAQVAERLGARDQRAIADWLAVSPRAVRGLLARPRNPSHERAVLLVLAHSTRFGGNFPKPIRCQLPKSGSSKPTAQVEPPVTS
jgi:hypothetical protein